MPIVPAAAFISAADTAGSRRMGPRATPNRTRITGAIAVTPPTTTANTRASRDQSPIRPTATTKVLMPTAATRARPQTVNCDEPHDRGDPGGEHLDAGHRGTTTGQTLTMKVARARSRASMSAWLVIWTPMTPW